MKSTENHILIIFGASGDLTKRKLVPALYELFRRKLLPEKFAIIGASRTNMTDDEFRNRMTEALSTFVKDFMYDEIADEFINILYYVPVDTDNPEKFHTLKDKVNLISNTRNIDANFIFYLSTPPKLYFTIPKGLNKQNLCCEDKGWRRLIVEKPFGYDLKSAEQLNSELLQFFKEEQIYRIDHYLGKETVQNLLVTRFSNGIFEPLWNRNYVHHIEITSAESIGVENRGGYYDKSGALRDMVQNHLLQLVSLVAMEPPTQISSTALRNETLKVFQSLRPIEVDEVSKNVIRGQYIASKFRNQNMLGYREEKGVDPKSRTETYVALKLFIDNWRWGGVPFYIRTGKRLPTRVTEIVVHFNSTPHSLFCFDSSKTNPDNQLVIRIQPDAGILLKVGMKIPGAGFNVHDVNMDFHYSSLSDNYIPEAYQRLLLDCMQGDSTLYARGDAVIQAWKYVTPILKAWQEDDSIQVFGYPAGTWGPNVADLLIEGENMTWRYPCKNLTSESTYCEL